MRERYVAVEGYIQAETDTDGRGAVCLHFASYVIDGTEENHMGDLWVPKSNLHNDSLDVVSEAIRGEKVEIHVVDWWLREQ